MIKRSGLEAVALMGFTCALLGVTEPSVRVDLYGPEWLSPFLFFAAAVACAAVVAVPDAPLTRVGSGAIVSLAFAWRAIAAIATNILNNGNRPLYAVVLYVGISVYISLTWHRVLPAPPTVLRKVREWTGEP